MSTTRLSSEVMSKDYSYFLIEDFKSFDSVYAFHNSTFNVNVGLVSESGDTHFLLFPQKGSSSDTLYQGATDTVEEFLFSIPGSMVKARKLKPDSRVADFWIYSVPSAESEKLIDGLIKANLLPGNIREIIKTDSEKLIDALIKANVLPGNIREILKTPLPQQSASQEAKAGSALVSGLISIVASAPSAASSTLPASGASASATSSPSLARSTNT
jgi:hypothetical protein